MRSLFLLTALLLPTLACKVLRREDPALARERADCLARSDGSRWAADQCIKPAPGLATKDQCLAIKGAVWADETVACMHPKDLAACQKADVGLVWDGLLCVPESSELNFYRMCINDKSDDELKHTIAVMSEPYAPSGCQDVYLKLRLQTSLSYHAQELSDLTPLAEFTQLRKLDLWNNKVSDLSALSALRELTSLNLGHNQVANLTPLSQLLRLQTLILSENQVINVKPLAELPALDYLDVSFNAISDLSPLSGRTFKRGYFTEGNPLPATK